jgi:hypothetical protein
VIRRKSFFSLLELLIVFSLVLLIGSFSVFYLQKTLAEKRFENNRKGLQEFLCFCHEMAIELQMDIRLVIEENRPMAELSCQIFCDQGHQKVLSNFSKRRVCFSPLFFQNLNFFECTFYSSGFVQVDSEKVLITDGKREDCVGFSSQVFLKQLETSKPIHPFALKKKENFL